MCASFTQIQQMSNKGGNPQNLKPFKPGESGNPGGKPAGARNRLQAKFLNDLADDYEASGKSAIVACRTEDPVAYVRAIIALMPKELEIKRPLEEIPDADIVAAIALLRSAIPAEGVAVGAGAAKEPSKAH